MDAVQQETKDRDDGTVLQAAAEVVYAQRQRLEALLERVRREHRDYLQRLRGVEHRQQETRQALELAEAAVAGGQSTDRTLELAGHREQHEALRQQQVWLTERLIALASAARKLQTAIRQSQLSADYLAGEVEDEGDQGGTPLDLGQLRSLEVQEEERQRLAREIHDGPAQVLANAIFQLEFCQRLLEKAPLRVGGELARLKEDVREGLAEVRYFIFDLRPGPLADLGLAATLRRYAENYQSRFGITTKLDLDDDLQRLSAAKEIAVFRVVQEALQNTRKHSHAGEVRVSLRGEAGHLVAEVEDNGEGFEVDTVSAGTHRHIGLESMRERAQLIRADLSISSKLGIGTRVTLRVPLESDPGL